MKKYLLFIFVQIGFFASLNAQIIPDGTYQIYSDVHQEVMVSATSGEFDVSMTTPNFSDDNQLWIFTHQGGNVYKIANVATGSFIGIKDGWCGRFGDVQSRYAISDANVEFLISAGNNAGSYVIQIAFTACNFGSSNDPVKAFDIQDGNSGAQIQTFDVDLGGANQQFRLISSEWNGSVDTSWTNTANWAPASIPTSSSSVRIPNVTNKPVVSSSASVKDILINSGSSLELNNSLTVAGDFTNMGTTTVSGGNSLLVTGSSSGNITYNVNVSDTNWHLVASPVVGQNYDDTWIVDNDIATGSDFTTNRGISTYDNTSSTSPNVAGSAGHWRYFQGGASAVTFGTGVGYALIKDTNSGVSNGNFSFTGTLATTVTPTITQGASTNWNLIGNSYPSYMDIAAFISANSASLPGAFQAIYVWNASTSSYDDLTTGHIHPGQAFFINSNVASGNASITKAMQSHQTGVTFYKNATPSIIVSIAQGNVTKSTQINYLDNSTTSLDLGLDIGLFDGVASDLNIYTHLTENNEGIKFGKQALPLSEIESTVVPIGVKAIANKEIILSISHNFSKNLQIYLEDREKNTFTLFNNGKIKISTEENIDGVGRFFIHVSSKSLSTTNNTLNNVSIYQSNTTNLKVVGLSNVKTDLSIYSIFGSKVVNTSFLAKGNDNISLPKLATGVYLIQIESEVGKLNRKIILE